MRIAKIALVALASSVAIASVQAATLSSARHQHESALELIKKKKKKDKAGHCGEYKFFSKKDKKCVDARKAKKKD
jgi:uncharacterized low-complexity protein